jgi:hypothetical protein
MSEDHNDPIAALTGLSAATERLEKARMALGAAQQEERAAEEALDRTQKRFDNFVQQLRASAPDGTYWDTSKAYNNDELS